MNHDQYPPPETKTVTALDVEVQTPALGVSPAIMESRLDVIKEVVARVERLKVISVEDELMLREAGVELIRLRSGEEFQSRSRNSVLCYEQPPKYDPSIWKPPANMRKKKPWQ